MSARLPLFVSTGSTSADQLVVGVLDALRRAGFDGEVAGLGGSPLAERGVRIAFDSTASSSVGIASAAGELLRQRGAILPGLRRVARCLRRERPGVVLLVDNPGYNLRLLAKAHALGLRTIYFVPPERWSVTASQLRWIARTADLVIPIFESEAAEYRPYGREPRWLGHPVIDLLAAKARAPALGVGPLTVALLPGSRRDELHEMLPVMRVAAARIAAARSEVRFEIASANELTDRLLAAELASWTVPVQLVRRAAWDVLGRAHGLISCSGTATLEAAVLGVPMVVLYRLRHRLDRVLSRWLLGGQLFALPNRVAGRVVVPELGHELAEPGRAVAALLPLLEESPARREMVAALDAVRLRLGPPGAIARVAAAVAERLARGS